MVHILRSTSLWGGGGLPDTIMPTFRGGGGKKYPKMYYVVCERSLIIMIIMIRLARERAEKAKRDRLCPECSKKVS